MQDIWQGDLFFLWNNTSLIHGYDTIYTLFHDVEAAFGYIYNILEYEWCPESRAFQITLIQNLSNRYQWFLMKSWSYFKKNKLWT